jgi:Lon protease-like protein
MIMKYSIATLPEQIPLFPLPGALLLPKSKLPLNLFEPKYLAMFDDALKTDNRLIGMIQPSSTPEGTNGSRQFHQIGCAGRIVSFNETKDGRYLITLEGVSRYRFTNLVDGFWPYYKGHVSWDSFGGDLAKTKPDKNFDRASFLAILNRYFEAAQLASDWSSLSEADEEILINSLSMLCPFDPEEKQALLEAPSLEYRRETLVTLMEFNLQGGVDEETLQ